MSTNKRGGFCRPMGPEFHHWGEPDPSMGPYGPGGEFIGGGPHGPGYPPGPDHYPPGPEHYPPGPDHYPPGPDHYLPEPGYPHGPDFPPGPDHHHPGPGYPPGPDHHHPGPGYPPGPDHHHPGPGYPPGPPADVRETERLLIPEGVVGVVIGKGFFCQVCFDPCSGSVTFWDGSKSADQLGITELGFKIQILLFSCFSIAKRIQSFPSIFFSFFYLQ